MLKIVSSEGEERMVHPVDVKPFLEAGWQLSGSQSQAMMGVAKRVAAQTQTIAPTGTVLTPARELEPFPVQSIKSAPSEQPTVILPLEVTPEQEGMSLASKDIPVSERRSRASEGTSDVATSPVTVVANDRVKELEEMHWRELEALAKELNLSKPEGTNWAQMIPAIIAKETENADQESRASSDSEE